MAKGALASLFFGYCFGTLNALQYVQAVEIQKQKLLQHLHQIDNLLTDNIEFKPVAKEDDFTMFNIWKNLVKERLIQNAIFVPCYLIGLEESTRINNLKKHLSVIIYGE